MISILHKELSSTRRERAMIARQRRKVPDYLRDRLEGLPGLFRAMREAVRGIYFNHERGPQERGVNVLGRLCKKYGNDTGLQAGRAAMYLARSRLSYWGVSDPDTEQYCSKCDDVLPIEEFDDRSFDRCIKCYEQEKAYRRTVPW